MLKFLRDLTWVFMWEQIPEAPEVAPVFMEDIPEDEQDIMGLKKYGAGAFKPAVELSEWRSYQLDSA